MIRAFLTLTAILSSIFATAAEPQLAAGNKSINIEDAKSIVATLSADDMQGRLVGTKGAFKAAAYLVGELQNIGYNVQVQRFVDPVKLDTLQNLICEYAGVDTTVKIVIGAHYDHLGVDPTGDVYNGADDNASGVAAVILIARAFKAAGIKPKHSVVFALWDGEEKGLRGSKHYVKGGVSNVKYYMNFDMIGRNTDESRPSMFRYLYTEATPYFKKWLDESIQCFGLDLEPDYRPDKTLSSGGDNASFAKRGIQVVWYHTDGHADYHKVTDTADKINYQKMVAIIRSAYYVGWQMAQ